MGEGADHHGASQRRGEKEPFLHEHNSSRRLGDAVSVEDDGRLCLNQRSSGWKALAIVLGFECLEGIAYYGVNTNLVTYFSSVFHETNAASARDAATWNGTSYFTPLLGAIIADTCLGRYWTLLTSSLMYLLGMIAVTLSAFLPSLRPPPCQGNLCPSATTAQSLFLVFGLYLVAFGSGGVKSCLVPIGADQFNDANPFDRRRKASFFSLFYVCINIGSLVASTVVVWIQENLSWALGYGLGALSLALALGGFLLGTPLFRVVRPGGSPLRSVAQVLVASFRKLHLDLPSDDSLLYEVNNKDLTVEGPQQLAHTNSFRFLDKAATISASDVCNGHSPSQWRLCTVTQVEELKILLRLLPIWISGVVYSCAYSQMYTTFIEQGKAMNTRIGSFHTPPASLAAFEVVFVICSAVVYNRVLIPVTRRYTGNVRGLSLLQSIGVGRMLMIAAMAAAATMEAKRLESARVGRPLHIAWQLPQCFVLACSEMFTYIGQMEFFYDQAPDSMKSMCTSFNLLSISLGSYLSSLIISLVMFLTTGGGRPGWLPDNLDDGHLDYFFWTLAALSTLNFVFYLVCAMEYTPKRVALEDDNSCL